MSPRHVLVVDDDPIVRDVLSRYLTREGFAVRAAGDGVAALDAFDEARPDIVLLDLMLPRLDGLEVFRRMRGAGRPVPVIMVSAKGEETDRLIGLELGADDYVTKPFSPKEVVARVRAVLRRIGEPAVRAEVPEPARLEFDRGELVIDATSREVLRQGRPVRLTRKEFDVLHHMAAQAGVVFDRMTLLEEVWDFAWDGDPSTVTVHVRRLREKIEDDPSSPRHLVTVWGVGYRFDP
jgi:DNA-binding response OmpR family regulator